MQPYDKDPFILSLHLDRDRIPGFTHYPFNIPAVKNLTDLPLHPAITFFVGENGSGKSTLIEALAVASGLNPEGGSRDFNFATRPTHSTLHQFLKLNRGRNLRKPKDGYFLRAESAYNLATEIDNLGVHGYGGKSLHEQSHGESFFSLLNHRLRPDGLYILDEPEAALSPTRQMSALSILHRLANAGSQLIIATHSPILLAYPNALIYSFTDNAIEPIAYKETEHFRITSSFLNRPEKMLDILLNDGNPEQQ